MEKRLTEPKRRTVNENPWKHLPEKPPFVLPEDKDVVEAFNRTAPQDLRLNLEIVPAPFVGCRQAPLVLLGNISTVTGDDITADESEADNRREKLRDRRLKDLRSPHHSHNGGPCDEPCLFLEQKPDFMSAGHRWWERRLKHILEEVGDGNTAKSILAQHLLTVEFFPYFSHRLYGHDGLALLSQAQKYSFGLVRDAVKRGAVIVFRHGERRWKEAVPELKEYHHLVLLKTRNPVISPGNCDGWSHIRDVIRQIEAAEGRVSSQ